MVLRHLSLAEKLEGHGEFVLLLFLQGNRKALHEDFLPGVVSALVL